MNIEGIFQLFIQIGPSLRDLYRNTM